MRAVTLPLCTMAALFFSLVGCYVPNKQYRPLSNSFIEVQPRTALPIDSHDKVVRAKAREEAQELPCKPESLATKPCLAFVEFDDMGEAWTIDSRNYLKGRPPQPDWPGVRPSRSGEPEEVPTCASQLCNALALVREADRQATQAGSQAIIVTFTHGWKHNAKEGDTNVEGFKQVLNFLQAKYKRRVVGIYISWRGNLVPDYLPVRQQFTFFNRSAAATRIPGASVTDALIRISEAAHSRHTEPNDNHRPYVVFVGHSFGGLFVERALTQALIRQFDEMEDHPQGNPYPAFADLVVLVNSAASATQAKQTLDFLASNKFEYTGQRKIADILQNDIDKPLILSVSSSSDGATKLLFPIGNGLPYLGFKARGSFRDKNSEELVCFSPKRGTEPASSSVLKDETPQGSYFLNGAAHMQILQSHSLVPAACYPPGTIPVPPVFDHYDPSGGLGGGKCFDIVEVTKRCNGTPYWLMEIDGSIVPDHSTIFTTRFVGFLDKFLLPESQMSDVSERPKLLLAQ